MYTTYSHGTPVVSANITTGEEVTAVAKGDTLSDVVLAAPGGSETIASATVLGFKLGNLPKPGYQDTILDGVPTYRLDPNGGGFFGMAEELFEVSHIVVEIPSEEEGEAPEVRAIPVGLIKSMSSSGASGDDGSGEPGGDDGD